MRGLACSIAVVTLLGAAATAAADERRIATLAPEGSPWMRELERGAIAIAKATNRRIEIKFYAGGSQGDERDVVRKMRLEQLDGAVLTSIGLGLIYPGIRVLELPYLWDSVEEVDYVREKMWPYFEEKFAEKGFQLLAAGDVGWIHVFSGHAIDSVDTLRAAKMWAWTDDPIVRHLFKSLGLDGIPLGVPAVLAGLQTGRIDACYGSPLAAVALQWHTRVSHMTAEPVGYGLGAIVMRSSVWEASSAKDRETQLRIQRKHAAKNIERVRRDNRRALAAMIKDGLSIVEIPAAFDRELREHALQLREDLAGELFSRDELKMVLAYRDEYRKEHEHDRKVARGVRVK